MKITLTLLLILCSLFPSGSPQADNDPNMSYYADLSKSIDATAYDELIDLYETYNITISFNRTAEPFYYVHSEIAGTPTYTKLEDIYLSSAIHFAYSAILALGSDTSAINLVDQNIDKIYLWGKLMINTYNVDFYYSDSSCLMAYTLESDENKLTANIFRSIALNLAKSCEITDYNDAFINAALNGFNGYDDENGDQSSDNYLNILSSNGIINYYKKSSECLSAGFLTQESLASFEDDFSEYAYQLVSSDSQLWELYSFCAPIREKADWVMAQLNEINPQWTREFFLSLSQPDNALVINNTLENTSTPTYFYANTYTGTYENTEGTMTATLNITYLNSKTGEIEAEFVFGPADDTSEGKSGSYIMNGVLDFKTAEVSLYGTAWISEQPKNYNMLNIHGLMFTGRIIGEFERDELTEIVLDKAD